MKYAAAAEELFRQFAHRHALRIEKIPHEFTDLMMEVPAQQGLSFLLTLCLSDDELCLGAGNHWGSWYLTDDTFEEQRNQFVRVVDGLVEGDCRVVEYWQFGRPRKTTIERSTGDRWEPISTRSRPFLLPFLERKKVVVVNKKK